MTALFLSLLLLASGCAPPPVDIDASLAISAGSQMELVQSFSLRRKSVAELEPRFDEILFLPTLLEATDSPRGFGLFLRRDGRWLSGQFTDIVEQIDAPPLLQPVGDEIDAFVTDDGPTGYRLAQLVPIEGTGLMVYSITTPRGNEVELKMLFVEEQSDGDSLVGSGHAGELYRDIRAAVELGEGVTGVGAGTPPHWPGVNDQQFTALFEEAGTWILVDIPFAEDELNVFSAARRSNEYDAPSPLPDLPAADRGRGVLHPVPPDGDNPIVIVSIPAAGQLRTFRLDQVAGNAVYQEVPLDKPITAVLSSSTLLVRDGARYRLYDFNGVQRARFAAGGLRFVHERLVNGRWYSYFSVTYWGVAGGDDRLFVRVYRHPTDRLHRLD